MTGDMGVIFNGWRAEKKAKRAANRESSPALLREAGVQFIEKNGGSHLIVANATFDFWPGTGKWIERATGAKGRGVFKLLARVSLSEGLTR